jgi:hypothetical protein
VIILETVTEYEENKLIAFEFKTGEMLKNDKITFEADNTSTKITNSSNVTASTYFNRCLFAFFKGMFKSIDQDYLDKFKDFANQQ